MVSLIVSFPELKLLLHFFSLLDGRFQIEKIISRQKWRAIVVSAAEDDSYFYEVSWNTRNAIDVDPTTDTPKYVPFKNWIESYPNVLLQFKRENNF